jgi:uncharacterized RDD family membrane protein YckC
MTAAAIVAGYDGSIVLRRVVATLIDYALLFGVLVMADLTLGNDLYRRTLILWLAIVALYFPLLEGLAGVTIGKRLLGLKVVGEHLHPPGIPRALVRTLLRPIDSGLIGLLVLTFSGRQQRIGDRLATTFVVDAADSHNAVTPRGPSYCARCGAELGVAARFCGRCGVRAAR